MQAAMEVNGEPVYSRAMSRFQIELQIWSDNYKVTLVENGMNIDFNYPTTPQAVYYDAISVKTKETHSVAPPERQRIGQVQGQSPPQSNGRT